MSSISDVASVPDLPLITIFDKLIFHLAEAAVFSLIAAYGRSLTVDNFHVFFEEKNYWNMTITIYTI